VPGSFEHGNKPSVSINSGEFLDKLSSFRFEAMTVTFSMGLDCWFLTQFILWHARMKEE
jgi:hypothetical protein